VNGQARKEPYLDGVFRRLPLVFGFILPLVVLVLALNAGNGIVALVVSAWLCVSIGVNCIFQIVRRDIIRALEDAADEIEEVVISGKREP
jgi:hypothetical protein